MQTTTCRRCRRQLRTAESVARQLGAACAKRERQEAAAADFKAEQVDKAAEVVELGGIVRTTRTTSAGRPVFRVITFDGIGRHLSTTEHCDCTAGLKGRRCWHILAARMTTAA